MLDEGLGFLDAVENFAVGQFIPQFSVEAFTITVLPWASGLDVERLGAHVCQPAAYDLGRHLKAIVGSDVLRADPERS